MEFETLAALELAEEYEIEESLDLDESYIDEEAYQQRTDNIEDICDEYVFDEDVNVEDVEPDLTEIINDNDSILPGAVGLGIALGLAEEIAIENKYREMDSIAGKRDVPAGSQLVAFKGEAAHSRTPAFERFVNSTLKR